MEPTTTIKKKKTPTKPAKIPDKKPKKPKVEKAEAEKKEEVHKKVNEILVVPAVETDCEEEKKIEEPEEEQEEAEDEGGFNITLINRTETPPEIETEIYKQVKRQPNVPNAPPPKQPGDGLQLTEEELAAQMELQMSVSLFFSF